MSKNIIRVNADNKNNKSNALFKQLASNPDYLCGVIQLDLAKVINDNLNKPEVLDWALNHASSTISTSGAVDLYKKLSKVGGDASVIKKHKALMYKKMINSLKSYGYYQQHRLSKMLKDLHDHPELKRQILLSIMDDKNIKMGYTYSYGYSQSKQKTWLANKIQEVIKTEDERIKFVNMFYTGMTPAQLKKHLSEITDGINNKKLKLSKNGQYSMLEYKPKDLKDKKTKSKVIDIIVKNDNAVKYLPYKVTLSKADLESLPPVRRLNFLEWYFNDHFIAIKGKFSSQKSLIAKISARRKKLGKTQIKLNCKLTSDDLSKLLFATAIKKNSRVTKFIDKYKYYEKIMDKNTIIVSGNGY